MPSRLVTTVTASVLILGVSAIARPSPIHAYAPVLTPEIVREAQTYYKQIAADFLPYPSEWSQALPGNAGYVMVVTPFIRLCMGIAADEFIAHYNHTEAEYLNPIIVERLNLFFADTLLVSIELPHPSAVSPPARPYVELLTADGRTLEPRSLTMDARPRELLRGGYTTRYNAQFALSAGIKPTDAIRITVKQSGRTLGTLTFNLGRMR
jgi:hypothetical protein